MPVTDYPIIQKTKKELNLLNKLYGLYNSVIDGKNCKTCICDVIKQIKSLELTNMDLKASHHKMVCLYLTVEKKVVKTWISGLESDWLLQLLISLKIVVLEGLIVGWCAVYNTKVWEFSDLHLKFCIASILFSDASP